MPKLLSQTVMGLAVVIGGALIGAPTSAQAECTPEYAVRAGDNLFSIAERELGDREKWREIYELNQDNLFGSTVIPGRTLQIPCPDVVNAVARPESPPAPAYQKAELTLLTGNGFSPFADRRLPSNGMAVEMIAAALELAPSKVSYAVNWDDDLTAHTQALSSKDFDMGFPWVKPDCDADPENGLCKNFHFSDPLLNVPVMLFTRRDAQFDFDKDEDIFGKTLCRPFGTFTHDLEGNGRTWLSDKSIWLTQVDTVDSCFQLLLDGSVDAVSLPLFAGADAMIHLGLRDRVVPLPRPMSEVSMHVIINKRHWRGTTHMYRVNAGLKALNDSGAYNEIVDRHLAAFWSQLK